MSGLDSWREEKQSAWLYRELAACEPDSRIADLFRALATAADRQSASWQPESGSLPPFTPSARARIAVRLARALGPRRVRPMLAALGLMSSLVKSLSASAIGCSRPKGPTRLGPMRTCMKPSSLRSQSVR